MKGAASARLAFHPDFPAHHFDQLLGNGQPQSGAAEFSRDRSVCLDERGKQFVHVLRGDPDAGVGYGKRQSGLFLGLFQAGDLNVDLSFFGELDRIAGQVDEDLPQSHGISHQGAGYILGDIDDQFQVFFSGFFTEHIGHFFQHIAQLEVQTLHVEFAGFDLGEIQDVVDQPQKGVCRRTHGSGIVVLLGIQIGFEQQVGEADDGVHRGADFVAHIRQEIALRLIRVFGRLFGPGDLLFGQLALGDVDGHAEESADGLPGTLYRRDRQIHGEFTSVFAHVGPLAVFGPADSGILEKDIQPLDRVSQLGAHLLAVPVEFSLQVEHCRGLFPDHFVGEITQEVLCALVEDRDQAFRIGRNDGNLRGRVEYGLPLGIDHLQALEDLLGLLELLHHESGSEFRGLAGDADLLPEHLVFVQERIGAIGAHQCINVIGAHCSSSLISTPRARFRLARARAWIVLFSTAPSAPTSIISGGCPSHTEGRTCRRYATPEPCPYPVFPPGMISSPESTTTSPGGPKPATESTNTTRSAPSTKRSRFNPARPPSMTSTLSGRRICVRQW